MMNDAQFDELLRMIAQGKDSKKAVEALRKRSGIIKKPPPEFTTWVKDNRKRVAGWKSKPYFMLDNAKYAKGRR